MSTAIYELYLNKLNERITRHHSDFLFYLVIDTVNNLCDEETMKGAC